MKKKEEIDKLFVKGKFKMLIDSALWNKLINVLKSHQRAIEELNIEKKNLKKLRTQGVALELVREDLQDLKKAHKKLLSEKIINNS